MGRIFVGYLVGFIVLLASSAARADVVYPCICNDDCPVGSVCYLEPASGYGSCCPGSITCPGMPGPGLPCGPDAGTGGMGTGGGTGGNGGTIVITGGAAGVGATGGGGSGASSTDAAVSDAASDASDDTRLVRGCGCRTTGGGKQSGAALMGCALVGAWLSRQRMRKQRHRAA